MIHTQIVLANMEIICVTPHANVGTTVFKVLRKPAEQTEASHQDSLIKVSLKAMKCAETAHPGFHKR